MPAGDEPQLCLTVDVETTLRADAPCDTIFGRLPGGRGEYGIHRIMDLCDEQGVKGTFFVDVYDHGTMPFSEVERAVVEIHERGHEVGLHVHVFDDSGAQGDMFEQVIKAFPYEEQLALLRQGKELIEGLTGVPLVSHRAGSYGANNATLRALAELGVPVDSSYFHGREMCDIEPGAPMVNHPAVVEGVTEVPVSVTRTALLPLGLGAMLKKCDVNWCNLGELQAQIGALHADGVRPVILFMHSFSLLDYKRDFAPLESVIERIRELLRWSVDELGARWVTLRELHEAGEIAEVASDSPSPPSVSWPFWRYSASEIGEIYLTKLRTLNASRFKNLVGQLR